MSFIEEIKWRGMLHDIMPGTDEMLKEGTASAYVGIDPTADSLHIGHLVSVMLLKHFQDRVMKWLMNMKRLNPVEM